jgi:hypothetical protein
MARDVVSNARRWRWSGNRSTRRITPAIAITQLHRLAVGALVAVALPVVTRNA